RHRPGHRRGMRRSVVARRRARQRRCALPFEPDARARGTAGCPAIGAPGTRPGTLHEWQPRGGVAQRSAVVARAHTLRGPGASELARVHERWARAASGAARHLLHAGWTRAAALRAPVRARWANTLRR